MEEDALTNKLDQVEKTGRNVIKWILYGVPIFSILVGALWFLLYSTSVANLSFVIPVRNFYQDIIWSITGQPPYTIQPQKFLEEGLNTYTLIGTFSKIDSEALLIYLKDKRGNTYIFNAESAMFTDKDTWIRTVLVPDLKTFASGIVPGGNTNIPTSAPLLTNFRLTIIEVDKPAVPLNSVVVRWNDKRSLEQIEKSHSENPEIPLNVELPQSFVLAEFK